VDGVPVTRQALAERSRAEVLALLQAWA
jgi:hypothetical protein